MKRDDKAPPGLGAEGGGDRYSRTNRRANHTPFIVYTFTAPMVDIKLLALRHAANVQPTPTREKRDRAVLDAFDGLLAELDRLSSRTPASEPRHTGACDGGGVPCLLRDQALALLLQVADLHDRQRLATDSAMGIIVYLRLAEQIAGFI